MKVKVWLKKTDGSRAIIKTYTSSENHLLDLDVIKESAKKDVIDNLVYGVDYGLVKVNELPGWTVDEFVSLTKIVELVSLNKQELLTICFVKKSGDERIITGYASGEYDSFGRMYFIDLERDDDDCIRLVDTRKIRWIIFNGTKYTSTNRE